MLGPAVSEMVNCGAAAQDWMVPANGAYWTWPPFGLPLTPPCA